MCSNTLHPWKARTERRASWLLLLVAGLAGCGGPRAPVLDDSPVYENAREGFRFMVPAGWKMTSRGQVHDGRAGVEDRLVEYRLADTAAMLMVTRVDLPESEDVAKYMAKRQPSKEGWQASGAAEKLAIDGVPCQRFDFGQHMRQRELLREIVAFRRGEHVYLFVGEFDPADSSAQRQIRRALEEISWKK